MLRTLAGLYHYISDLVTKTVCIVVHTLEFRSHYTVIYFHYHSPCPCEILSEMLRRTTTRFGHTDTAYANLGQVI